MRLSGGIIGAFLILVLSTCVEPAIEGQRKECPLAPSYVFYPVSGDTADKVLASMRGNGPKDQYGKTRFASTDWEIAWNWKLDAKREVDLPTVKLTCSGVVTLPKLVVTATTPPDLIRAWNSFAERLREHELKHLEHASRRAPEITRRLAKAYDEARHLSPHHANQIVRGVISEIKSLDKAYDARTTHGQAEGAWRI